MKTAQIITALLMTVLAAGSATFAEEKPADPKPAEIRKQVFCPVMGGKINKAQYVDVKGYRIYVCCAGCKARITKDPDTYIKKLQADGITLEKTPEKEDAKPEAADHTDHAGHEH